MKGSLLNGRLVLVTGVGRGIELETGLGFMREGASVVLADLALDAGPPQLDELRRNGAKAWAYELDAANVGAVGSLAFRVKAEVGDINVLANNAGIIVREGVDSPAAHRTIRRVMDVNLYGAFNTTHAWLPALRRTKGTIINAASGAFFVAQANRLGYSSSEVAVKLRTQTRSIDLAAGGIRVNGLAPGSIETSMTARTHTGSARVAALVARTSVGQMGFAGELARPADSLASSMAGYVNGVTLPVDGGMLANNGTCQILRPGRAKKRRRPSARHNPRLNAYTRNGSVRRH